MSVNCLHLRCNLPLLISILCINMDNHYLRSLPEEVFYSNTIWSCSLAVNLMTLKSEKNPSSNHRNLVTLVTFLLYLERRMQKELVFIVVFVHAVLGLTQQEINDLLKAHNDERATRCVGPLSWDDNVAKVAQNYANRCTFAHNNNRYSFRTSLSLAKKWRSEKKLSIY
jgi:hypothetical protein